MRSVGKLRPEWGYLASAPSVVPAVRIALVATVIGGIGGAVAVVSLVAQPGPNDNSASIASHARVTGAPVIAAPSAPPEAAALGHGPVQPTPMASGGLLVPASASTTGAVDARLKESKSPTSATIPARVAASAVIPSTAEATAASVVARADVTPEAAPVEGSSIRKHYPAAKSWRHRRHRHLFADYHGRGYPRFGSMHDDW